jgi:hypothetical protein
VGTLDFFGEAGLAVTVDVLDGRRDRFTSSLRRCEALVSVSVMLASCLLSRLLDAAELALVLRSMAGDMASVRRRAELSSSWERSERKALRDVIVWVTVLAIDCSYGDTDVEGAQGEHGEVGEVGGLLLFGRGRCEGQLQTHLQLLKALTRRMPSSFCPACTGICPVRRLLWDQTRHKTLTQNELRNETTSPLPCTCTHHCTKAHLSPLDPSSSSYQRSCSPPPCVQSP